MILVTGATGTVGKYISEANTGSIKCTETRILNDLDERLHRVPDLIYHVLFHLRLRLYSKTIFAIQGYTLQNIL
jgi:nucleoside-diphosphate-sugar epimerase